MVHMTRYTSRADRERAEQEEWLGGIDGEDIGSTWWLFTDTLWQTNIAMNIPIFNRTYIFNPGPFSSQLCQFAKVYCWFLPLQKQCTFLPLILFWCVIFPCGGLSLSLTDPPGKQQVNGWPLRPPPDFFKLQNCKEIHDQYVLLFMYFFLSFFIYLFIYLFIRFFIYLCISVFLSFFIYLFIYSFLYLFMYFFLSFFLSLFVRLFILFVYSFLFSPKELPNQQPKRRQLNLSW